MGYNLKLLYEKRDLNYIIEAAHPQPKTGYEVAAIVAGRSIVRVTTSRNWLFLSIARQIHHSLWSTIHQPPGSCLQVRELLHASLPKCNFVQFVF